MTNSIAYISLVVIFILLNSSLLMIKSQPTNGTSDTTNTTTTTTTTTTPLNNNTTTPIDNTTAINNSTRTASTTAASAENKQNCDCLNGGTCTDNKCKCASGYYGSRCENILCDLQTSKNDTLSAKQCLNGYCLRNTETNEYTCKCKPSHTGALCDRPVCLDYCYNGGGCDDGLGIEYNFDIDSTLTTNLSCLCPSGNRYYGARCEFDACYESRDKCSKFCWMDNSCNCNCNLDCDNTYCNKVGLCVLDDIGLLACKCIPGYTGKRCTIDKCQGYCFNNGTCLRNETVSCICPSGFNGTRCEYNIQKHVPSSTLPMKRNSTISHLIYGLTITVIICLCIIGVYLLIQKGVFDNLDIMDRIRSLTNRASNRPPSSSSGPSITRTNLFFNKLEDEQNIIQSEING